MEPGQGIHSIRLFKVAIVDVILTVTGAQWLSQRNEWGFWPTLAGLFGAGIILHRALDIRTTVDKLLFPNA